MKDIDFESIGKKLKEIRLSKGLPQDAVASAAVSEWCVPSAKRFL